MRHRRGARHVSSRRNMGSPARREPHGDRVPIVVAGVTTCQEGWESQPEARRVTGEPLEPETATRNAERPKGEKRKQPVPTPWKRVRSVLTEGGWKRAARAVPRQPPIPFSPS